MKGNSTQRAMPAIISLFAMLWIMFMAMPAFAAQEGIRFEKRRITDPQFGGAVAATVNVPQGWILEGKADWNFQNVFKPAYVGYVVKSPADDAWFTFSGPYVAACYFSQSPNSGNEAQQQGRLLVPPMKPEDLIKMTLENDRAISGVKIVRVDKLAGNAANREKQRRDILGQLQGAGAGLDYQVDEALASVTFTKNGVAWEAMFYASARYLTGNGPYGQYCAWDAGPFVGFQAHAGKLKDYEKILAAICGGSTLDPVWVQSMDTIGNQLVQQRIASAHQAAMAAQRAAQATYAQAQRNRSAITSRSESNSRVMSGWTDAITGTDRWNGGGESHSAPTGYNHGWRDSSGNTYYTNDSTFNPNHSSNFSGDWSQMKKAPW
ncbi:exported hypothetical protein [uncultured delta proteobacterium]|uniref:Uncharacterized protein n=1 Tax=uncultured delta proteobacterium TaxID=34034 RepID=A0A212KFX7_9DELT|nr:exported hypothetical protein [uncultured delta proteobacterium]